MLCGLGFDAKVAQDFANQPKRGLTTYINQVIKNFFSAVTYSFKLKFGNKFIETEAYFICVANSNQFGNNFTIAPQANLSDGLLDVVIVTNQNKISVLIQTLIQVTGWNKLEDQTFTAGKKGVIYFQTDKLTIYNKSDAPLHIDGDPAETSNKFKFEIIPKCFSLIQP
jgi:diacylglycerol kinase family enzyme